MLILRKLKQYSTLQIIDYLKKKIIIIYQKNLIMNLLFCILSFVPLVALTDAPEAWQIGFQDPATPVMQGIIDLHHDIMFFYGCDFSLCFMDDYTNIISFSL